MAGESAGTRRICKVTPVVQSMVLSLLLFAAFVVSLPGLVSQIRGDHVFRGWIPASLIPLHKSAAARVAVIAWDGAWAVGGQAVVLYLAFRRLEEAEYGAAVALSAELDAAAAAVYVLARLRARSQHSSNS
jgi:hypothetical protein